MKRSLYVVGCLALIITFVFGIWYVKQTDHSPIEGSSNEPQKKLYIALGDSVAAGVGLSTATDSSACDRTNESYPNLVSKTQAYKLKNISCSGATIALGVEGGQTVNRLTLGAQLEQLAVLKPDIVSLTVGANDSGWLELIVACYQAQCGSEQNSQVYSERLKSLQLQLSETIEKITLSPSKPRVVVTTYYQVFPASDIQCSDLSGIDASEIAFGRDMQQRLNKTITQAVSSVEGAVLANVDFSGHELCTSDPWVQGLTDPKPYHPTEAGHTRIAEAVVGALKGAAR